MFLTCVGELKNYLTSESYHMSVGEKKYPASRNVYELIKHLVGLGYINREIGLLLSSFVST